MSDWQPIETAPTNGKDALIGVWVSGDEHQPFWSCWTTIFDGGPLGCDGLYGDEPTHWHPIPAPPTPPKGDRADG